MENLQEPTSTVEMIKALSKIIDFYRSRKITYEQLVEIILKWEKKCPQYIFEAESLKKSIIARIGVRRLEILKNILKINIGGNK